MVRIKDNLKDVTCDLWYYENENSQGEYIGTIKNQLQLTDVQLQIKEKQEWGYRIYYNKQLIKIDRNGILEDYPDGLYTQLSDMLMKLI